MHKRHRSPRLYDHLSTLTRKRIWGNNDEENNRQRTSLHGLRTLRSLLHRPTFQIQGHRESLQQGKPPANQPRTARSGEANLVRHPMPKLRRGSMRNRMPLRRYEKRPRNWASHS